MVTRIQKTRGSSSGVLDYNEEKVMAGLASVVGVRNIPDDSQFSIYDTFSKRESLPSISEKTRNFSFHLTVNPGPGDGMTEEDVVRYIDDVMKRMGYGGQPYVIYRHNDIERQHYHIVSTNIEPNGKVISDSYFITRIKRIQEALAKKYGYTIGLDGDDRVQARKPGIIPADADGVLARMRANIDEVMRYHCRDSRELRAALLSYGMELVRTRRADGDHYSFKSMDAEGRQTHRAISLRKVTGKQPEEFLADMNRMFRGSTAAETDMQTVEAVRRAFADSRTMSEFRRKLAKEGIVMLAADARLRIPAKSGREADFYFVDNRRRNVTTLAMTGLSLNDILRLAREAETKKKKAIGETAGKARGKTAAGGRR